ncbi:fibrillarin-like rRNA/tRNA 2'-O-methyltransferase [Candidatus Marsarchaeota archaeon]|nr:fibrillarin-like rRNA/tRNA 2'-O-methyltransferase [Candidatus Marsarchaeota archaeon]
MHQIKKIFDGVFLVDGKLATMNLDMGRDVYGEELIEKDGLEYRLWNPYRSKLGAAISKGMKRMEIKRGSRVLYLGAATGTTCSHVSDIIGEKGILYCVEISERNVRDLLRVCERRSNMLPIFNDARNVREYGEDVGSADVIYQDIAARDQAEILLENCKLLKKGGYAYIAIKSQSIDVSRKPSEVYKEFLDRVSKRFSLLESIDIMPYDKMHLFVVLQKT